MTGHRLSSSPSPPPAPSPNESNTARVVSIIIILKTPPTIFLEQNRTGGGSALCSNRESNPTCTSVFCVWSLVLQKEKNVLALYNL